MYNSLTKNLSAYQQRTSEAMDESKVIIKALERMGQKVGMIVEAQQKKNFSEVQKHLDHYNELSMALCGALEHNVDAKDPISMALWNYLVRMSDALTRLIVSKNPQEGERIATSFARLAQIIEAQFNKERQSAMAQQKFDKTAVHLPQEAPHKGTHGQAEKVNFSV